jgi:creatinine amidohydrolase
VGDPRKASPEKGAKYFKAVTEKVAEFFKEVASADRNDLYQ